MFVFVFVLDAYRVFSNGICYFIYQILMFVYPLCLVGCLGLKLLNEMQKFWPHFHGSFLK